MEYYNEYIKGGEILIAPSSYFKDIYLLKCSVCDEYFSQFDKFLLHHLTHYGHFKKGEPPSPSEALQELLGDMDKKLDVPENVDDDATTMYEDLFKVEGDSLNKDEYNSDRENELDKTETSLEEFESDSGDAENIIHESIEIKRLFECTEDANGEHHRSVAADLESIESNNDESTTLEEHRSNDFVQNFMNSKENVIELIALYKNQPKLWNTNLSTHLKLKSKRIKCLQQIATELENTINIKMTVKQLDQIIVYMRKNYKTKLKKDKVADEQENPQSDETQQLHWFCKYLSFLKPILEKNVIAILDNYSQDLKPEQIVQILNIYKRCPYLWDTSLIENYCYNKRYEGIQQMRSLVHLEMNLEVNENILQKYVRCVNINFSREKRRYMGIVMSEEGQSEYFEHMMFLYDHVGPFECCECRRKFNSHLHLKVHQSEHDGLVPLKCSICKKGFKVVETYIYHIRRHMNDLSKSCKECGKRFLKASELKSHMRYHTGARPYCCEVCGASFRHSHVLNLHKKRHEKKFTFFCPTCSKGFYTKTHMEMHNGTHTDERQFVCATCGKAFKTRRTMQRHEFTHEEGRNHICSICEKAFKNKINLKQHFKKHLRKGSLDLEFKPKLNSVVEKE